MGRNDGRTCSYYSTWMFFLGRGKKRSILTSEFTVLLRATSSSHSWCTTYTHTLSLFFSVCVLFHRQIIKRSSRISYKRHFRYLRTCCNGSDLFSESPVVPPYWHGFANEAASLVFSLSRSRSGFRVGVLMICYD